MTLERWGQLGRAADQGRRLGTMGRRMAPGGMAGLTESASPVAPPVHGGPVGPIPVAGEPAGVGGGCSVAWLNNSEGDIGGLGGDYQQWNQLATAGDTSWFEFPTDYWGPADRAAFRFVQPGIFTVIARVTGTGLTSVEITAGGSGTLISRGIDGPYDGLCGSGMYIAEQVEPGDYEVLLVQTVGAAVAFSSVAVVYWPGEPAFTQF